MTVSKVDLDLRTAANLDIESKNFDLTRRLITSITKQFLFEIRRALVEDGEVVLPGVGTLKVVEYETKAVTVVHGSGKKGVRTGEKRLETPVHLRVSFRKASALRNELKRSRDG